MFSSDSQLPFEEDEEEEEGGGGEDKGAIVDEKDASLFFILRDLDDLPDEAQDQNRTTLHNVLRSNVYDLAAY